MATPLAWLCRATSLRTCFVLSAAVFQPGSVFPQSIETEPADEEELRRLLDLLNDLESGADRNRPTDGREWMDILSITGMRDDRDSLSTHAAPWRDSLLVTRLTRVDKSVGRGVNAPGQGEWSESSVLVRGMLTRSAGGSDNSSDLNGKSIVRWAMSGRSGRRATGELTMRTVEEKIVMGPPLFLYSGPHRSWEFALGVFADPSTNRTLEGGDVFGIRDPGSFMDELRPQDGFRRSSLRSGRTNVAGVGGTIHVGSTARVNGWMGRIADPSEGTSAGRIRITADVTPRLKAELFQWVGTGSSGKMTGFSGRFEDEHFSIRLGASAAATTRWSTTALAGFFPVKGLSLFGQVYDIRSRQHGLFSDKGAAWSMRWRLGTGMYLELNGALGMRTPAMGVGGVTESRHESRVMFSWSLVPKDRWSIALKNRRRETPGEEAQPFSGRTDVLFVHSSAPAERIRLNSRVRLVIPDGGPPGGRSFAMSTHLRFRGELLSAGTWGGIFHCATGQPIWTTHPGYGRWPVSLVLSGHGYYSGVTVLYGQSRPFSVAAYALLLWKEDRQAASISILSEFRL